MMAAPTAKALSPFASGDPALRDDAVLAAARAYGEQRLPGRHIAVREFGVPSAGLDESVTHFVAIESEDAHLLARVTVSPNGLVRVDHLTAS